MNKTKNSGRAAGRGTPLRTLTFGVASLSWINPRCLWWLLETDWRGDPGDFISRDLILRATAFRFANLLEVRVAFRGPKIETHAFTPDSRIHYGPSLGGFPPQVFQKIQQTSAIPGGRRFTQIVGARTESPLRVGEEIGQWTGGHMGRIAGWTAGEAICQSASAARTAATTAGCLFSADYLKCRVTGALVESQRLHNCRQTRPRQLGHTGEQAGAQFGRQAGGMAAEELLRFPPIWSRLELDVWEDGRWASRVTAHSLFPSLNLYAREPEEASFHCVHRYDGTKARLEQWYGQGWDCWAATAAGGPGPQAGNPWCFQ